MVLLSGNDFGGYLLFLHVQTVQNSASSVEPIIVELCDFVDTFPSIVATFYITSVFLSESELCVRYVSEGPRSWISSSFVSALPLQCRSLWLTFYFFTPLTMLVQCPQLLLGDYWFLLFQGVMAGHFVSVRLKRIHFPVRPMLPALSSSRDVDSKYLMQLYSLCDLILLYSGGPCQVSPLSSSFARGYPITLPSSTPMQVHHSTPNLILAHRCPWHPLMWVQPLRYASSRSSSYAGSSSSYLGSSSYVLSKNATALYST